MILVLIYVIQYLLRRLAIAESMRIFSCVAKKHINCQRGVFNPLRMPVYINKTLSRMTIPEL